MVSMHANVVHEYYLGTSNLCTLHIPDVTPLGFTAHACHVGMISALLTLGTDKLHHMTPMRNPNLQCMTILMA